jgi:hypothetical protein
MDGAPTVVKSISLPAEIERCQIETEIENMFDLGHPLIARLNGFHVESGGRHELTTVRLYATRPSLAEILLNPPAWWTPIAKAKGVAGIIQVEQSLESRIWISFTQILEPLNENRFQILAGDDFEEVSPPDSRMVIIEDVGSISEATRLLLSTQSFGSIAISH